MPRRRHRRLSQVRSVLIGLTLLALGIVALVIAYGADQGLPWRSTYLVSVRVPDAAELHTGDPVQIGGARVGIVRAITAQRPKEPYAQITLAIFGGQRVPVDSTVSIRALSILGAKLVVLQRGRSHRMLAAGAVLPLAQARPAVDIQTALTTFSPPVRRGIQGTVSGLAAGVAGRGDDLNALLATLPALLGHLRPVADTLAAPGTNLTGFIDGAQATLSALVPVAGALPVALGDTATTFRALVDAQPALGQTLDRLPDAEAGTTTALRALTPALRALRTISVDLRPAGPQLRPAVSAVNGALSAAPPTLVQLPALRAPLTAVAADLAATVPPRSAALANALAGLDTTVNAVRAITGVVGPAQQDCNVLGITLRNGGDVIGEGDAQGSWFTFQPILSPFMFPTGSTSSDTHVNEHPIEDARGCAAGNMPYGPGPQFGNPPASELSTAHDQTAPPAAATARAAAAGLLTPAPGARLQ